ncbi:uncharacterized protein [Typha latifolia]|uniref:uncharacterized protein n=1 Tax=Typha latifolia TaxID=4733 RepID=UPI003C2B3434
MAIACRPTTILTSCISTTHVKRISLPKSFFPSLSHSQIQLPRTHLQPKLCHCLPQRDLSSNSSTETSSESRESIEPKSPIPNALSPTIPSSTPSYCSAGLVFDESPEPCWDCGSVGSPVVKRYISDDKERWLMWYAGADSIGLAASNNGIHWERGSGAVENGGDVGQVMQPGNDWWVFDTGRIEPSDVLIMSSSKLRAASAVYWLYYTGYNPVEVEIPCGGKVFRSLPGLAISQDGRHWARIEGDHHSGALMDVGAEGEWDSLFIAMPKVIYHERGDLRMYYHSFDTNSRSYAIGIARSRDGIRWVKLGKVLCGRAAGSFDEAGVRNGYVVRDQKAGKYIMVYEGVSSDGKTSIGLAESVDGLKNWRQCGDKPILRPSVKEDAWDNQRVGSPCLIQMDGYDEWRLYYSGNGKGGRTGIGMAISEGADLGSFKKWKGFQI